MKKILKKVAATILAASMVIGMTACGTGGGGSSTQGGTSSNKSGKIKIGVSIWSSTDVLGSQCKKILDEAAKALDVDVQYVKIAKFNSAIHLYSGILFCTSGV